MSDNYICNECNKVFRYRRSIIKHIKVHNQSHKVKFRDESHRYQCKHCGRRFTAENQLETHIRYHHQQTIYLPTEEDRSHSTFLSNNHDAGKEIDIKQEVLSEELSLDNLNTAENGCDMYIKTEPNDWHDVTIDINCLDGSNTVGDRSMIGENICDSETNPIDCQKHVTINGMTMECSCNFCNKNFIKSSELLQHVRFHTVENPYSCDICHKKFTQSGDLQTHIRVHTGEKSYSCDIHYKKVAVKNFQVLPRRKPRKKSNLNACSKDARRMRAKRAQESEEQIAARNAAQRIRTAELRRQETQEQHDERLQRNLLRTKSARERHIATFRERDRERQRARRAIRAATHASLQSSIFNISSTEDNKSSYTLYSEVVTYYNN